MYSLRCQPKCTKVLLPCEYYLILMVSWPYIISDLQWNARLMGVIASKPHVSHQNCRPKGTSLGRRLAPEMIPVAWNCAVGAVLSGKQAPHRKQCFWGQFFGACKTLLRNLEIFHRCMLQHTISRLLFQTWSKSMQVNCPKGRIVLVTEKTECILAPFGRIPGVISPVFLRECTLWSLHFCSRFH